MSEPHPAPETGIQAARPTATTDTNIQARLGDGPLPAGIQEPAFLARLKSILELHKQATMSRPKPAMWGLIQFGTVIVAIVMAFSVFNTLNLSGAVNPDAAGIAFVGTFIGVCLLPDTLLWLGRRSLRAATMRTLWDSIESMLRTFSSELEYCGGSQILGDRVELEALVQVLDQRLNPARQRAWGER